MQTTYLDIRRYLDPSESGSYSSSSLPAAASKCGRRALAGPAHVEASEGEQAAGVLGGDSEDTPELEKVESECVTDVPAKPIAL